MADEQRKIPVRFYESSTGKEPVKEFLLKLTKPDRKTVGADLSTLQKNPTVGMPLVRSLKSVKKGLYELRVNLEDRIARVFFFHHLGAIVLLHGIIKKSQKTPKKDLDLAKKRQALVEVSTKPNQIKKNDEDENKGRKRPKKRDLR